MVNVEFLKRVNEMKKAGYSEKEIANFFGLNTTELRVKLSVTHFLNRKEMAKEAQAYKEEGMSVSEIAEKLGKNETNVRLLLDTDVNAKFENENVFVAGKIWKPAQWYLDLREAYLKNPERTEAVIPLAEN